mgnify:CR=1
MHAERCDELRELNIAPAFTFAALLEKFCGECSKIKRRPKEGPFARNSEEVPYASNLIDMSWAFEVISVSSRGYADD